jgi:hypothetical protein
MIGAPFDMEHPEQNAAPSMWRTWEHIPCSTFNPCQIVHSVLLEIAEICKNSADANNNNRAPQNAEIKTRNDAKVDELIARYSGPYNSADRQHRDVNPLIVIIAMWLKTTKFDQWLTNDKAAAFSNALLTWTTQRALPLNRCHAPESQEFPAALQNAIQGNDDATAAAEEYKTHTVHGVALMITAMSELTKAFHGRLLGQALEEGERGKMVSVALGLL